MKHPDEMQYHAWIHFSFEGFGEFAIMLHGDEKLLVQILYNKLPEIVHQWIEAMMDVEREDAVEEAIQITQRGLE